MTANVRDAVDRGPRHAWRRRSHPPRRAAAAKQPRAPWSLGPASHRPILCHTDTLRMHPVTDQAPSAADTDIAAPWEDDNQAWWDWYMDLAHNPPQTETTAIVATPRLTRPRARAVTLEPDPQAVAPLDLEALARALETPYPLSAEAIAHFRAEGYVKLPGVLSPRAVATLRHAMARVLESLFDTPLDGGDGRGAGAPPAIGRRFLSAELVWLEDPIIRQFVLSPRIAEISAALLGVERVRLYHDNLLAKQPGAGRTPWHYDDHHFPLATHHVVTAWIAAQAIPRAMGPLAFARGIDTWRLVADVAFSKTDTSYDRRVAERFARARVAVDDSPFAVGDVSFHHNVSFHTAGANATTISRCALANTFFADGARVVDAPTMVSGDWRKFLPGVEPGGVAASPLNPVCWPAGAAWTAAQRSEGGDDDAGT